MRVFVVSCLWCCRDCRGGGGVKARRGGRTVSTRVVSYKPSSLKARHRGATRHKTLWQRASPKMKKSKNNSFFRLHHRPLLPRVNQFHTPGLSIRTAANLPRQPKHPSKHDTTRHDPRAPQANLAVLRVEDELRQLPEPPALLHGVGVGRMLHQDRHAGGGLGCGGRLLFLFDGDGRRRRPALPARALFPF